MPGKSFGQRSLVVYSPWGPRESDTKEQLHFDFSEQDRKGRVKDVFQDFSLALFGEGESINVRQGALKDDEI